MTRSPAAERMRAHRSRRRAGLRCLTIELRTTEIDALIRKKLLKDDAGDDVHAIRAALYRHLDETLNG
jgi:SOS response regulatory protein OraA/RecX